MIYTAWMKIIYILILAAAALFSVLYLEAFSVFLLLILLMIPVFMMLSLVYIRFNLKASLQSTGITYHRSIPQAIQLVISNNGILPVGKAAAQLICRSRITGEEIPVTLIFPIPARNVTTIEFTITVPNCGVTDIVLKRLQFTDYIRLFSWRMRPDFTANVMTLPSGAELGYKLDIPCSETDDESNIYSKLRAGDDPSEVYRIREYQPGDLQKRIHWKLSSRTDTIWVKEYSFPIRQRAAVLVDYTVYPSVPIDSVDTALEAAYSLAAAFIHQSIPTVLYWYNAETDNLEWNELNSMSELNDCFTSLLSQLPSHDSDGFIRQASEQASIRTTNAVYYCTPSFNSEHIAALDKIFRKNRLFVITAEFPSERREITGNVIYVREGSLAGDLQKLSDIGEVMRE